MSDALVLIIGGTRATGLHAAQLLRTRGTRLRVLARDPHTAARRLGDDVEIVRGDLTDPASLDAALADVHHVIFTAGVPSGQFARRSVTRATEYEGVLHTLAAAHNHKLAGRFVYMTSIGVRRRSFFSFALNLLKGGTFHWRHLAEDAIRSSGLDYAIVRAAFLTDRPARQRELIVRQTESPLSLSETIARADVAGALVEAVYHPAASRTTFEVAWGDGPRTASWTELFNSLKPESIAAERVH